MKSYFQLTRFHTVPLEAVPAIVGGLIATGGSITSGVLFWGVYGILYHITGYGHNSLRDWEKGYDKRDPYKQHHPLNAGTITHNKARALIRVLMALTVLSPVLWLAYYNKFIPFAVLIIGAVSGIAYNEIGKTTVYKFIPISIAHSTVFVVPYLALGGDINITFIGLTAIMLLWVFFQIAISGEIKDIGTDEENLLRGYIVEDERVWIPEDSLLPMTKRGLWLDKKIIRFSIIVRSVIIAITTYLIWFNDGLVLFYAVVLIAGLGSLAETVDMLDNFKRREYCIRNMAIIELQSMALFLAAAGAVIGLVIPLLLFILAVLWVVSFNRYQWGTILSPEV